MAFIAQVAGRKSDAFAAPLGRSSRGYIPPDAVIWKIKISSHTIFPASPKVLTRAYERELKEREQKKAARKKSHGLLSCEPI